MLVLDFSCIKEEYDAWFDEYFYEYKENVFSENLEVLVDTKNPYGQKLNVIEDEN
jgi:hypothetical protein